MAKVRKNITLDEELVELAEKNKGKTMSCVADELGYTQCVPVHQYLKNRNLRWNQL